MGHLGHVKRRRPLITASYDTGRAYTLVEPILLAKQDLIRNYVR